MGLPAPRLGATAGAGRILRHLVAGLTRRQIVTLAGVFGLTVVAAALEYGGGGPIAIFVAAAGALAGLAYVVSFATEAVGERFGPAVTGVLQSTLGNLPELFIVIFALAEGEIVVARFSVLGSLFANALLILGLVIVAGARQAPDSVMRFHERLPKDTATLLLVAVFIIVLLGISSSASDRASDNAVAISVAGAVILLAVYTTWLVSYLRDGAKAGAEPLGHHLPLRISVALLAVSGVGAALVSDWFVGAIDPAVEKLGISKAFTGLVIVAIAGNAVENVAGITLAAKGKSDLAISVVKNSVSQIAAFLFPALVLISLAFENRLTFVVAPVYVGALLIMALAVWQITGDGQAATFEGLALMGIFVVLAILTFYE